jgi:hypothetical protein
MKGALGAIGQRRLHHAHAELPARRDIQGLAPRVHLELAPAEQLAQGIDLVEGQIVPGVTGNFRVLAAPREGDSRAQVGAPALLESIGAPRGRCATMT